jgi:hypothetical protein
MPVRANLVPHAHLRTLTRHEIAIQSGHKVILVFVRRDNRDIFAFFRQVLRLVLQSSQTYSRPWCPQGHNESAFSLHQCRAAT